MRLAADFPVPDRDEWRAQAERALRGRSLEDLVTTTPDGIEVAPLYTGDDDPGHDAAGLPGAEPFTRGAAAAGRPGGWDVRQVRAEPDPGSANAALLADLAHGVTSVLLEVDLDGRGHGVRVRDVDDLDRTLRDVVLDAAPVELDAGAAFLPASELLAELWERRGIADGAATGALGADPLGALAAAGRLGTDVDTALAEAGRLGADTAARWPAVRALSVRTQPYVDAGGTDADELACALSTGVAYLRALADAGLDVAAAARQIEVTLTAGTEFFRTIAKLRAARRTWARVCEVSGVPESDRGLRLHVTTAGRALTARDPWVNMLRATAGCFAAAVGGAHVVTVAPFDAALGKPDTLGRRIARNTQTILLEEAQLSRVVDPAGGSWFLEQLTEQLAQRAWRTFRELERADGIAAALLDGSIHRRLAESWDAQLSAVATRRRPVTGVSEFPDLHEQPPDRQVPTAAAAAGGDAVDSAPGTEGDAAAAGTAATEIPPLPSHRLSEPFEALRDAADAHAVRTGARPRVLLATLGPLAEHTARTTFATNLFAAGGIEAVEPDGGDPGRARTHEELARALGESGTTVACLCGSDDRYAAEAGGAAAALKAAGATYVYLAGRPGTDAAGEWQAAEVDEVVGVGSDVVDVLRRAHRNLGVSP